MMTIVCNSWIILVRRDISPSNPFLDYSAVLPGQKWDPMTAQGFNCPQYDLVNGSNYCSFSPTSGPFWFIYLRFSKGRVDSITFCVREGALTVGDLALLWGRPAIQIFQGSGLFKWSSIQTTANGTTSDRGFSYYFPLSHVTFEMNKGESQKQKAPTKLDRGFNFVLRKFRRLRGRLPVGIPA
jgi:hypothetical protein